MTVWVRGLIDDEHRHQRLRHIRGFEEMLHDEGTTQIKLFLHVSHEEQGRRLQNRLDDPEKRWKFDPSDLVARKQWDDYHEGYEVALTATSTEHSPWYVVPADQKWARDVAVARLLVDTLRGMRPEIPPPMESLESFTVD